MAQSPADNLPPDIRLIAAVSRLIDIHQSRRESGGAYVPEIPEKAGLNLYLALSVLETLHEIEMDRGIGAAPVSEVASRVLRRVPDAKPEDLEYCLANLKQGREIHYRSVGADGELAEGRTWDSTPLLDVQDGFSQVGLTENARLLLRVSSLRESWLYSDLDADRLIKAIERGQFQDVPAFCRAMTLDLAAKSKQLSNILERPSLSELRSALIGDGGSIAASLAEAAATVGAALDRIFSEQARADFEAWESRGGAGFSLGNLQADLEMVLQNAEALSRRFMRFLEMAQKVRNEGVEPIRFLEIADALVEEGGDASIERCGALLESILPWGYSAPFFCPSMLVGAADLRGEAEAPARSRGFTVDPARAGGSARFADFLKRNRETVMERLRLGPASFSEIMGLGEFALEPGETPMDFFGAYASPGLLGNEGERVFVGLTGKTARFGHSQFEVDASDPLMYLETDDDPL